MGGSTITLAIFNAGGTQLASATLNAASYRGSATYNNNPLYPGGIAGPGGGEALRIFNRGAVGSFKVTVNGPESGTAWVYSVRCRLP